MDIVVVGGGKLGNQLLAELTKEDHNVTLIEKNEDLCNRLLQKYDIDGFVGNGGHYDVQMEAHVDKCDVFISVTSDDQTNIIAAAVARNIGADYTIARVRDPGFAKQADFMRERLGISMMINPDYIAAKQIFTILHYPSASSVEEFYRGKVNMIEIPVKNSDLDGMTINEFRDAHPNIIACLILRDEKVIVPHGSTEIHEDDLISITGTHKDLLEFCHEVGLIDKKLKSLLIIGGGRITHYLLKLLEKRRMEIKVIELDKDAADYLSQNFPKVIVINGDGTDQDFLKEERIGHYDSVVNLTGIDEENMLLSLYALKTGVDKVITKINRTDLISLVGFTSLQGIVTPTRLISNIILRFVRSLYSKGTNTDIDMLYRIADNQAEAVQLHIKTDNPYTDVPLEELDFKPGVIMAFIIRDGEIIFPTGKDAMKVDDHVIFVTADSGIYTIDEMLK